MVADPCWVFSYFALKGSSTLGYHVWKWGHTHTPVIDDYGVSCSQVNAQASCPSWQQKTELRRIGSIESINSNLSLCTIDLAINSLIPPFLQKNLQKHISNQTCKNTNLQVFKFLQKELSQETNKQTNRTFIIEQKIWTVWTTKPERITSSSNLGEMHDSTLQIWPELWTSLSNLWGNAWPDTLNLGMGDNRYTKRSEKKTLTWSQSSSMSSMRVNCEYIRTRCPCSLSFDIIFSSNTIFPETINSCLQASQPPPPSLSTPKSTV